MKPSDLPLHTVLLLTAFVLAGLVNVASALQWPLLLSSGLTALMFGALFFMRRAEARVRRRR